MPQTREVVYGGLLENNKPPLDIPSAVMKQKKHLLFLRLLVTFVEEWYYS